MKQQVFNPFLPSYEYIPDAEPRVFGERLYIYGSHDRFNGTAFCQNDYVCWSAPVDDLSDWKYEGVIYKKTQDPRNKDGKHALWAPDVCRGVDGRYYLYYCLDYLNKIGVAVSNSPAGPFEFLSFVKYQNGEFLGAEQGKEIQFDPGIFIDDDNRVYLFSGNGPRFKNPNALNNSVKMELFPDMVTIKNGPFPNVPISNNANGTDFEDHPFFEASSMRKINGKYYFIYSSCHMHELCWAVSNSPMGEFRFGGTLVSIGDIGIDGNTEALNYIDNTHGSVAFVNGKWYVFYHRQTNRHTFSRQACAEQIHFDNGKFYQAKITSCGLNGGPLKDNGKYEARIACHLYSKNGTTLIHAQSQDESHPAFTQTGEDREENPNQYINNMKSGATAGFRYFDFKTAKTITVETRGTGKGKFVIKDERNGNTVAEILISSSENWCEFSGKLEKIEGVKPLYFTFIGEGSVDFNSFTLA